MANHTKLEHITNGFRAAHEILNMHNTAFRSDSTTPANRAPVAFAGDALKALAQHAPHSHRESLGQSANAIRLYGETYTNLQEYLGSVRNQRPTRHEFVKTLSLLAPILNEKQRLIVDKIMKLYEIF